MNWLIPPTSIHPGFVIGDEVFVGKRKGVVISVEELDNLRGFPLEMDENHIPLWVPIRFDLDTYAGGWMPSGVRLHRRACCAYVVGNELRLESP